MKMPSLVSIIILNWNGRELTRKCLKSIKKNTDYQNYEIIVVDQGSKDGSVEMIEKYFPNVMIIKNRKNVGFAAGNNQGFAKAKGKYFFMLSNDVMVTKGWLTNVVNVAEADKYIASIGSLEVTPDKYSHGNFSASDKTEDVETTLGAAMLIRRDVVENIGGLDAEHFSPIYGEENDWCYRARNAGYRIVRANDSVIIHHGLATVKKEFDESYYFVLRETNRIKAMLFNLPISKLFRFIPGLGLIFITSLLSGRLHFVLKSYWYILSNLKEIMKIRKKRMRNPKIN